MRIIVTIGFLLVLGCLGAAGYFMLRGGQASKPNKNPQHAQSPELLQTQRQLARNRRMATALGWRVALSILLFSLVLLAWSLDWIRPHAY